jgi:chromosome partitioning protein
MSGEKRNAIAVMNTKGGVGKSTLVLAIAEVMSAFHGKNVLVVDADAQASVSVMLMAHTSLHRVQADGMTLVDLLAGTVLRKESLEWTRYVVGSVGDVDDARSVYLLPSDVQLTLLEREISRESAHARLRSTIASLLAQARSVFDIVLIDCPPGLSVLTECWLREADWHMAPTKADYISSCALDVFRRFRSLNPEMGFAENLGVVVNMRDRHSPLEEEYHRWLADDPENRLFKNAVPRTNALQYAAHYQIQDRSYPAKYPGDIGAVMKALTREVLGRIATPVADWAVPAPRVRVGGGARGA